MWAPERTAIAASIASSAGRRRIRALLGGTGLTGRLCRARRAGQSSEPCRPCFSGSPRLRHAQPSGPPLEPSYRRPPSLRAQRACVVHHRSPFEPPPRDRCVAEWGPRFVARFAPDDSGDWRRPVHLVGSSTWSSGTSPRGRAGLAEGAWGAPEGRSVRRRALRYVLLRFALREGRPATLLRPPAACSAECPMDPCYTRGRDSDRAVMVDLGLVTRPLPEAFERAPADLSPLERLSPAAHMGGPAEYRPSHSDAGVVPSGVGRAVP